MEQIIERLKRLPFVAAQYRRLHPSNSTCGCCGLPWAVVTPHSIQMRDPRPGVSGSGFFPVCEYCWQHRPQVEIDNAIVELHRWWERDSILYDIQVPYSLEAMLDAANKQRNEEIGEIKK